jgi:hypothetical protein
MNAGNGWDIQGHTYILLENYLCYFAQIVYLKKYKMAK